MNIILVGILSGIVNGMFGSGAGMILIPAFISKFNMDNVQAGGTTIVSVLFLSIISSLFYIRNISDFNIVWLLAVGGIIGGIIGAKIIKHIPGRWLGIILGVFMIFTGIRILLK